MLLSNDLKALWVWLKGLTYVGAYWVTEAWRSLRGNVFVWGRDDKKAD